MSAVDQESMTRPTIRMGERLGELPTAVAGPEPSRALRVVLVGDFSGRSSRGVCEPLAGRRMHAIDRDDLEPVLARLHAVVRLGLPGGDTVELAVRELDELHPDVLYDAAPIFEDLRRLRARLKNPASFAAAAAELVGGAPPAKAPSEAEQNEAEQGADALDLLGATLAATEGQAPPSLAESLIREVVAPYVTPAPDPRAAELIAAVDRAAGATLRSLLHAPEFQAFEARWRALDFLVRRVETSGSLRLELLDASQAELLADAERCGADFEASDLYRVLVEPDAGVAGATAPSLVVALDALAATDAGAALAAHLGQAALRCGAALIAGAASDHLGVASLGATPDWRDWPAVEPTADWTELRSSALAASIALVPQGFLLRLPYGPRTQPTERIDFRELSDPPRSEQYLWGSGAVVVAALACRAFAAHGWELGPGLAGELDRLPLHVHEVDGESCVTPLTEIELSERAGELLADRGLMSLFAVRGTDRVGMGTLRSIAGGPLRSLG